MRTRTRLLAIASLLAATTACAPTRYLAVPKLAAAPSHVIAPERNVEARFGNTLKPLDDAKSVLYLQSFGGGGVALGLLLGPIGVAANAAAIAQQTNEDIELLKGRLPIDPAALYQTVAKKFPELGIPAAGAGAVRLSPQVLVVKTEKDELLLGCALWADYGPAGQPWKASFVYQAGLKYPKADVAKGLTRQQLDDANAQLRAGFEALTALYLDDMHGKLAAGRDVRFNSEYLNPRVKFELRGKELPAAADRVVIRGTGAMYSFPRAAVQVEVEPETSAAPSTSTPAAQSDLQSL